MAQDPIRLGVSACLLGQKVRYDATDCRADAVAVTLAGECELVPICPESELGMGTPRETVHLIGDIAAPQMVGTATGLDWTQSMNTWCEHRLDGLATLNLAGFVLKARSPSCGVMSASITPAPGQQSVTGNGLFPAAIRRRWPRLPLISEGELEDPVARRDFLERIRGGVR